MKYNQEDIDKIKQLVFSDNIDSIHVGISLAIYTLGMSVKELVDLIDESDVIQLHPFYYIRAFDTKYYLETIDDVLYHCRLDATMTCNNYLNNKLTSD